MNLENHIIATFTDITQEIEQIKKIKEKIDYYINNQNICNCRYAKKYSSSMETTFKA